MTLDHRGVTKTTTGGSAKLRVSSTRKKSTRIEQEEHSRESFKKLGENAVQDLKNSWKDFYSDV